MSLLAPSLRGSKIVVCYKQFRKEVSTCLHIYIYIIFVALPLILYPSQKAPFKTPTLNPTLIKVLLLHFHTNYPNKHPYTPLTLCMLLNPRPWNTKKKKRMFLSCTVRKILETWYTLKYIPDHDFSCKKKKVRLFTKKQKLTYFFYRVWRILFYTFF